MKIAIAACGLFCVLAVLDFLKPDVGLKEEHRQSPDRAGWQQRRAILEAVIGGGGLLYFGQTKTTGIILPMVLVICVILWIWNDWNFKKGNR